MDFSNQFGVPGLSAPASSVESELYWSDWKQLLFSYGFVLSSSTDAASTPTTSLRPGLVLGQIAPGETNAGYFKPCLPTNTDGSDVPVAVLPFGLSMLDAGGSAASKFVPLIVGGPVRASALKASHATANTEAEYVARFKQQMSYRFVFDDLVFGLGRNFASQGRTIVKSAMADLTLVAGNNGATVLLTYAGASTVNLPAIAPGLEFEFWNLVDQNLTIVTAGSADNIVCMGDIAADQIAISTMSEKLGVGLRIFSRYSSDLATLKWHVVCLSEATVTPT